VDLLDIVTLNHLPSFIVSGTTQLPELENMTNRFNQPITSFKPNSMDHPMPTYKPMAIAIVDLTPPSTRQASPSPLPSRAMKNHFKSTVDSWRSLNAYRDGKPVCLDGESLDVASVVAVAKYEIFFRHLKAC
jgi:hypothetical protein